MKRTIITLIVVVILFTITGCSSSSEILSTDVESSYSEKVVDPIEANESEFETEAGSEKEDETYQHYTDNTQWWWEGEKLSSKSPKVEGPSGVETYFSDDVSEMVKNAKEGYLGEYWVREDGVKMFGDYIICKCKYDENQYHPNLPVGTCIPTTLGVALVCSNDTEEDICIAVTW